LGDDPARAIAVAPMSNFMNEPQLGAPVTRSRSRLRRVGRIGSSAWLTRALSLLPALFALSVLTGIVITIVRLVQMPHPDPGFGQEVNSDAGALYLGQPLYQDPADGYTGILYTAGLPMVVSLLYRIDLWTGWPLLLTILATLLMMALAARLAYRPLGHRLGDRALAMVEAIGVGALAWLLVSCIHFNGIFGSAGLHDHVGWALAILGLVALPAGAAGSWRALALSVVLVSAAFWTKQTTIAASATGALWIALAAAVGAVRPSIAARFWLALLALNGALLGLANYLTSGWEYYFNFIIPARHPLGDLSGPFPANFPKFMREDFLPATGLTIGFAGTLWCALAWHRVAASGRSPLRAAGAYAARVASEARSGIVLAFPVLVTLITALVFRRGDSFNLSVTTAPSRKVWFLFVYTLFPAGLLALLFAGSLLLALVARRARVNGLRRSRQAVRGWLARAPDDIRIASVLALSVVIGFPAAFYFRQKLGADDHYYIGIAWAVALLGAIAYRRARAHLGTSLVAGGVVAGLFVSMLVISPSEQAGRENAINLPTFSRVTDAPGNREHDQALTVFFPQHGLLPARTWSPISPELLAYAKNHVVYDAGYGGINLRSHRLVWPSYDNFSGDLSAGVQPRYLINAWLSRRFDAVSYPFSTDERKEFTVSGAGKWEQNYLWKLNQVLRARYRPSRNVPAGFYERRPGPDPAPWMRRCFGPFHAAGTTLRITRGGGFWCRSKTGTSLTLVKTPAPYSDVRTEDSVQGMTGVLTVTLPERRGFFEVLVEHEGGDSWKLRGEPAARGIDLAVFHDGVLAQRTVVPRRSAAHRVSRVELSLVGAATGRESVAVSGPERARVPIPEAGKPAVVRLAGSRESHVKFDLARLRLAR
jgi:hypothetical protein